jgi:hypothetical protein
MCQCGNQLERIGFLTPVASLSASGRARYRRYRRNLFHFVAAQGRRTRCGAKRRTMRHPLIGALPCERGKVVAQNVLAHAEARQLRKICFKTIGQLASIGRRAGVASILGINISGFLAWWMWCTIYLSKLPRLEKKLRVALEWILDLMFSNDLCQSLEVRSKRKNLKPVMTS